LETVRLAFLEKVAAFSVGTSAIQHSVQKKISNAEKKNIKRTKANNEIRERLSRETFFLK
jgi:hypothetical protein